MQKQLPESFLTFHYSVAFPNFLNSRPKHIKDTLDSFNIIGLLKNLFMPYKRMVVKGKATFLDRLSFNVISALVGAMARIGLVIAGILVVIAVSLFDLIAVIFYFLIPLLSYSQFEDLRQNYILGNDLKTTQALLNKIASSHFFANICIFFDASFKNLFTNLPDAQTLKIKEGQKITDAIRQLYPNWPELKRYFAQNNINTKIYDNLLLYLETYLEKKKPTKVRPLGQNLIFGYTNTLDNFGIELSKTHLPNSEQKQKVLLDIEKILSRPHNNNALIIGDEGVGKHTVLQSLVSAIENQKLTSLATKRVILLDTISLLSSAENLQETKANIQAVFEEAKGAGNIILAIDDIDKISSNQEGRVDLSEILNNVLTDNSLPIIGLATLDDFNQFIRPNAIFLSLFEKVEIEEATAEETATILLDKVFESYKKDKISANLTAIWEIVDKSSKLMPERKQPEKSIVLLEDCQLEAKRRKLNKIDNTLVDEILSQKTKTPVGTISQTEAQKLQNLESFLHRRVIGQNEAIIQIAKALRRARAEIRGGSKPIGSFLFLGPTGVGKTETAKTLAEVYFGNENKMARLDMSEYQSEDALQKLIGNQQNKKQGYLTTLIRQNPYGLLLLDEFEKANSDVQNLFLQVLDEGHLTDGFGKSVSFTNTIIIATSNAAAEYIREEVEKKDTFDLSKKLIDYILSKNLFSPELINRFEGVIVYQPLSNSEIVEVTKLMLEKLARDLKNSKNITLEIDSLLAENIAREGYVTAFGARPIRRLIADKIEDEIAKLIISGQVKSGDTIKSATLLSFI